MSDELISHPRALSLHPSSARPPGITGVAAMVQREADGFALSYLVRGDLSAILLPASDDIVRRDELWKSTCFEAFVRARGQAGYVELNFAPSRNWAAYAFDDYRAGMRNADINAPFIDLVEEDDGLIVMVELFDGQLDALAALGPLEFGLTAVIEETSGAKSYWALKHPPGKPDFHHADGFQLELA